MLNIFKAKTPMLLSLLTKKGLALPCFKTAQEAKKSAQRASMLLLFEQSPECGGEDKRGNIGWTPPAWRLVSGAGVLPDPTPPLSNSLSRFCFFFSRLRVWCALFRGSTLPELCPAT